MQFSRSMCRTVMVALLGMAFFAMSAHAQNIFGSILGTVTDPSGAVLPGASVTVTNLGTGEKRTATTDGQGNYQILSLPRGDYKVDVDSPGFKHFQRTPIDVVVDQQARVNVQMVIGEQSQQVTVNAAPPIMQTDSASLGQAVEGKAVQTLPLNGRNVLALVALVPGVVPQGGSSNNLSGQNVFAAGNYQIDGGNANESSVLVDGAPVNTSYGNTVELVIDQDDVQEFNAQTHNNTAEFGMYTGGVINMSTKSGTNAFHGTAYEYLRNTVLDANNFFANRQGKERQAWHQNQFGFNVGGPVLKNRAFFFFDYQGYRQTQGWPYFGSTPTQAELSGDFSGLPGAGPNDTNPVIFDPTTNPRVPFSYNGKLNVIPPNRISTVAQHMIGFPYFATPNTTPTSTVFGPANNWFQFGHTGGNNDQYNIRGDQNLSAKQTAFERYTWWRSTNLPADPFGNGVITGDPISPEAFTTQQIVLGDTYVFNPTSVADIHLSWMRWNYERNPGHLGYNLNQLGFNPASDMGNISALNEAPNSSGIPRMSMSNPSIIVGGTGYIYSINNNYTLASTYQKIWKQHTFKVGIDLRRLEMDYYQNNNPGGVFTFDNVFTAQSVGAAKDPTNLKTGQNIGNSIASFLIGDVSTNTTQTEQISTPTFQTLFYQGYFGEDTWQVTNKLTATLGLRYEVPGVYVERHGWADTFNPTEVNPIVGVPGAFDLVSTPQHPERGVRNENWDDWAPRFGVAYRVTNSTVLRAGWGKFVAPADLLFGEAPLGAAVNFINNLMVNTTDGQQTPYNTLDNPYPNGLAAPPHRDPSYQQILLGGNAQALNATEPNAETYQWNVAVEHQFPMGVAVTAAYSALLGDNLPVTLSRNTLPDSVVANAAADPTCQASYTNCYLNQQVKNPFYGHISQGVLQNRTVTQNQLLRPFPQYGSISNTASYSGISDYNALEIKLQKRMSNGGQLLGSYSFSKLMTNAESVTGWLDSATGSGGWQDYNNPAGEYAVSSYDSRQRLVVSYMYPLPVGKGERFMNSMPAAANAVLGNWGLEGITTFQEGYPLHFSMSNNFISNYAFQGTWRPNVVSGCQKQESGSMTKRINEYFNTACFASPANFTYGNEPRNDNTLRGPGVANWDMSLFKNFPVHESMNLDFRVEAFNVFNRVQFGYPNTSVGSGATFGTITTQLNNPRILQVSGRFNF